MDMDYRLIKIKKNTLFIGWRIERSASRWRAFLFGVKILKIEIIGLNEYDGEIKFEEKQYHIKKQKQVEESFLKYGIT